MIIVKMLRQQIQIKYPIYTNSDFHDDKTNTKA